MTYLNKGAHYSIFVEDTVQPSAVSDPVLYCTSVQVAFNTESRRQNPLESWRLWDDSRGADEGNLFNGRFQAIEYIESSNFDNPNDMSNIQVVHSDGFSLVWRADPRASRRIAIKFQLNFLSTDFSNAKGVHGTTMQLCGKTEEVSTNSLLFPNTDSSINYCKIQIFRSHGAERKTANDAAAIAKKMEKLERKLEVSQQQSTDIEESEGKHRKKTPTTSGETQKRPKKLTKAQQDAMRFRIQNMQRLLAMVQRRTNLDLQGEKQRDCDWYPTKRERPQAHSQADTPDVDASLSPATSQSSTALRPVPTSWSHSSAYTPRSSPHSSRQTIPNVTDQWSVEDTSTQPEQAIFYVRPVGRDNFEPIYLSERTASELTLKVAAVLSADPARILRCIWISDRGLKIVVDDDVVRNMNEGQGMQISTVKVREDLFEFELEF